MSKSAYPDRPGIKVHLTTTDSKNNSGKEMPCSPLSGHTFNRGTVDRKKLNKIALSGHLKQRFSTVMAPEQSPEL